MEVQYIILNKGNYKTIHFINLYRPPDGNSNVFFEKLTALMTTLTQVRGREYIIMGDFNINTKKKSVDRGKLELFQTTFGLKQLIKEFTHKNPNGENTTLDLILTNSLEVFNSGVSYVTVSDHYPTFVTRKHVAVPKVPLRFVGRTYKNYVADNFTTGLKNVNWQTFWDTNDPTIAWTILLDKVHFLLDFTCPIKTFNITQKKKEWVTNDLIVLFKDRDQAMQKYRRTLDDDDHNIAIFLRNLANEEKRLARNKYNKQKFETYKNKPKEYARCINNLLNPKNKNPIYSLFDKDLQVNVPFDKTADFINNYFATIGPKLANNMNLPYVTNNPATDTIFSFTPAKLEDVLKLIRKININKSSGVNNISSEVLKDTFLTLPYHLLHIVNLVIATSSFPDIWKEAIVTPLPKGGDQSDVNNLRPISILPLPAKIMEKILHRQLLNYLNVNDLIFENQDGFRPKRSTHHSIEKLTNNIAQALNRQHCTTAIYLDFSKAFDTLNHNILATKLTSLGLNLDSVNLMTDYLSNRKQRTKANGILSEFHDIVCGVPQGSVLGPLLFLTYINDMHTALTNLRCQHYADDTVIYLHHSPAIQISTTLNDDLTNINTWCTINKLSLNSKKTKFMVFGNKALRKKLVRSQPMLQNAAIAYAPTYKYLGVTLDPLLNYSHHVPTVKHSVRHKVYLFNRSKFDMPEYESVRVVKTMILPVIDYCDVFYDVAGQTCLEGLQVLINKSLKIAYRRSGILNTAALHRKAKLNKLKDRRHFHLMELAFKATLVEDALDVRPIRTRRHDQRLLKHTRSLNPVYARSLEYRLAGAWNNLVVETRAIKEGPRFTKWNKEQHEALIAGYV